MRNLRSLDALRASLLTVLGLTSAACGDQRAPASPDAGTAGSGDAGDRGDTGGGNHGPFACVDPQPILVGGADTGYDTCKGGTVRRRAIVDCPVVPIPKNACSWTPPVGCTSSAECDAGLYGTCSNPGGNDTCSCVYGCVRDSDCASGQICACGAVGVTFPAGLGNPVGTCTWASCNVGTCGAGQECAEYFLSDCPQCVSGFACQTAADQCFSNSDCPGSASGAGSCALSPDGGARVCTSGNGGSCCGFGRPFLVGGAARLAPAIARDDWRDCATPNVREMPPALRERLTEHWMRTAQMEHASIAAFARFVLQLVSFGASSDLVAGAQRAMAEETTHARLAFGLASAYAGRDLGPGPIAIDGCLDGTDVRAFVATTFVEGCIGETVAALEAREALEHARDPVVRDILETIAHDEARHAELAWRTVAWALATLGQAARDAIDAALATANAPAIGAADGEGPGDTLRPHGVLGEETRIELRRACIRSVVVPVASALLHVAAAGDVGWREGCSTFGA
jgi:hypothetical protein